jgi:aminoglycoside phosphotransferase
MSTIDTLHRMQIDPDPKLPFMSVATSPSEMLEVFNRHVFAADGSGQRAASVTLEHMDYRPHRRCFFLYGVRFTDRSDEQPLKIIVSLNKDPGKLAKVPATQRALGNGHDRNADAEPAIFLPEYGCLIEFFPQDWKLPALRKACDTTAIAKLIQRNSGEVAGVSCSATILQYRPHRRCVFLYTLKGPGAGDRHEVIGKVYEDGKSPSAVDVFNTQESLRHEARKRGLVIPRPIAVMDGHNVLLMEKIRGKDMKELLFDADDRVTMIKTAANALSILHDLPFDGPVNSLPKHLARVRKHADRMFPVVPELTTDLLELLDRLETLERRYPAEDSCLIHGDYNAGQILLDGDSFAIVDLDRASLGDPAIDVGNFLAQFPKDALRKGDDRLRDLDEPFLAEYLARTPRSDGFLKRIRVLQGLALLRMSLRNFRVAPLSYETEGLSSLPVLLMKEAEACIAGL